jgi:hypothetical protein
MLVTLAGPALLSRWAKKTCWPMTSHWARVWWKPSTSHDSCAAPVIDRAGSTAAGQSL